MSEKDRLIQSSFLFIGSISAIILRYFLYTFPLSRMLPKLFPETLDQIILLTYVGIGFIPFILGGALIRKLRAILIGAILSIIYLSYIVIKDFISNLNGLWHPMLINQLFLRYSLAIIYILFLTGCWFLVGKIIVLKRIKEEMGLYVLNGVSYTLGFIGILALFSSGLTLNQDVFSQILTLIGFSMGIAIIIIDSLFVVTWNQEADSYPIILTLSLISLKEILRGQLAKPNASKLGFIVRMLSIFLGSFVWFFLVFNGFKALAAGFGASFIATKLIAYVALILSTTSISLCLVVGYVNNRYKLTAWIEHPDVVEPGKPFVVKLVIRTPEDRKITIMDIDLKENETIKILRHLSSQEWLALRGIAEKLYLIEITRRPSKRFVKLEFMINYLDEGEKHTYKLESLLHVKEGSSDIRVELLAPKQVHSGERFSVVVKITNNSDWELEEIELVATPSDLELLNKADRVILNNIKPGESREVEFQFTTNQRGYRRVNGFLLFKGKVGDGEVIMMPEGIVKVI